MFKKLISAFKEERSEVVGEVKATYNMKYESEPGMDGSTYEYEIKEGDRLPLVSKGNELFVRIGINPGGSDFIVKLTDDFIEVGEEDIEEVFDNVNEFFEPRIIEINNRTGLLTGEDIADLLDYHGLRVCEESSGVDENDPDCTLYNLAGDYMKNPLINKRLNLCIWAEGGYSGCNTLFRFKIKEYPINQEPTLGWGTLPGDAGF